MDLGPLPVVLELARELHAGEAVQYLRDALCGLRQHGLYWEAVADGAAAVVQAGLQGLASPYLRARRVDGTNPPTRAPTHRHTRCACMWVGYVGCTLRARYTCVYVRMCVLCCTLCVQCVCSCVYAHRCANTHVHWGRSPTLVSRVKPWPCHPFVMMRGTMMS